jgi:SepF-like predicted cell division protein (DUF552 family)
MIDMVGIFSFAAGSTQKQMAQSSTALGADVTIASLCDATAMGQFTQANGANSLVIGQYNDTIVAPQSAWNGLTPLFIVGNGEINAPSNALVIRKDGRVGIGTNNPTALLSVNGTANNSTGSWSVFSDARVKDIKRPFTSGLETIMQLRPVVFKYNDKAPLNSDKEHIGVIAQELEKVAPYMVSTAEVSGISDLKEVDNQAYTFLFINAIQELKTELDAKSAEMERLKAENESKSADILELKQMMQAQQQQMKQMMLLFGKTQQGIRSFV